MQEPKASTLGSQSCYCSSEHTKKSCKAHLRVFSFSAVRDHLQTLEFKACEVNAGDSSLGGATLTSAHTECGSGGSPQPLSATTCSKTGCLHANAHFSVDYAICDSGHVTSFKDLIG